MTLPESDDDLRGRFRELSDDEAAHAPSFESIRRGRPRNSLGNRSEGAGFWLRPAWAIAAAVMLALGGGWWAVWRHDDDAMRPAPLVSDPEIAEAASIDFLPEEEWQTATDGLLAEADVAANAPNVERLTREIAALLQP